MWRKLSVPASVVEAPTSLRVVTISARTSALARCQVLEVLLALRGQGHKELVFDTVPIVSYGEIDRATSLRVF